MLLKVHSASVLGIQAEIVDVEVNFTQTMRFRYHVVGLPDTAVKESGERVRAAICNCGFDFPRQGTIIVNLAPAGFKKEGSCYDLPIALGVLGLTGKLEKRALREWLILGELSLDGKVRPIRGALPVALGAVKRKFKRLLLPADNAREAAAVRKIDVYCAARLPQVLELLNGNRRQEPLKIDPGEEESEAESRYPDFSHVKAQQAAKRALEVSCSGGHNLLLIGPPGAGKTMLARRIPSILPSMSFSESLETTAVHSVCGLLNKSRSILARRPFRSPHHSISGAGLVGGGSPPRPGEISLAHNGVLFLDELPEFQRRVLETLRQPCEVGEVTISRAIRSLTFPSRFMLVAAMNPCPCGYANSLNRECVCSPLAIHRYLTRISGPFLDRMDLQVEVPEVPYADLAAQPSGEPSRSIAERVEQAREIQRDRFSGTPISCNAQMGAEEIQRFCTLTPGVKRLFDDALPRLGFSARAYDRILKMARTIADLAGSSNLTTSHVSEAIQYRSLDRSFWKKTGSGGFQPPNSGQGMGR